MAERTLEDILVDLRKRVGLLERRRGGGGGGGGGALLYPPLPDPSTVFGPDSSGGGNDGVWVNITEAVVIYSVNRPLWVQVDFGAQIRGAGGANYAYIGVAATGALTLAANVDQLSGDVEAHLTPRTNLSEDRLHGTKMFLLPVGSTTLTMQKMRSGGTVPGTDFPVMTVTPLYWEGQTFSGSKGAPGPAGTPGSVWYDSNPIHWDPVNVPNPRVGDQFMYPISGDVFTFQGPLNDWDGWLYIGSIAGPQGPPGNVYWVNVEDYGAVGNGSTDDTAAIQAAIDSGKPVYIPAKVFVITDALVIHSGTRIFGDRSASFGGDTQSTIKQTTPDAHGLRGSDVIEFQCEDVLLAGPASGVGDGIHIDRIVNAATLYLNLSRVYVQDFGQDGVSVSNAIVSTFERVVCERNGRHGFNLFGVYQGAAGTSVALNGCYANNNGATGFTINSMVYLGLNGCAAEHQAIDYDIISCQGISFTGCGSEQSQGTAWKISDGSLGIGLYSCWSYRTATNSVVVTNNSRAIVIAGFVENTPEPSAVNSIRVDDGCRATVMTGNFIAPLSYAPGTTVVLDDGGGAINTYGDVSGGYFAAKYGGDFGGYRITSVAAPVDPSDAATKSYVDAAVAAAVAALLNP